MTKPLVCGEYVDGLEEAIEKLKTENKLLKERITELKAIVTAPWKCDVCGNYVCNSSAQLEKP